MYVFYFFNRVISTKVPHKGAVIEIGIYKTVKDNFQLFLAHLFLQSEFLFSSINALLHSFEIWSSNGNQLSVVMLKRATQFWDLILLLSMWSFSCITFFLDFCRSINWNLSGFCIMLLFLNQFTANSDSFFNVSS